MKFLARIAIVAMVSIAAVTCLAVCLGHDSILVTGATSGIVGIAAGVGAYFKGKSVGTKNATKD